MFHSKQQITSNKIATHNEIKYNLTDEITCWLVERRNALAKAQALLDAALLHATGKRVLVIVNVQFDFIRKYALPLNDAQLSGIFRCVRLLHRDQQL